MSAYTSTVAALPLSRLEQNSSMLARIFDGAAVGMAVSALSGQTIYFNKAFCNLLGYDAPDAYQLNVIDMIHPDDRTAGRLQLGRLMRGETDEHHGEYRFCRADGSSIWVMLAASLIRDAATGEPEMLISQLSNIELQKRAEEAAAHAASRLNFALESARQGVWDHDIVNDTMFYSRMWRVMRGIPPDEEVDGDNEKWFARIHPDDRQYVQDNFDRQDKGDEDLDALEYRELTRDGRYIWILSRGKPVEWDEEGNATRTLGTDTDITRLKTVELELAAEKERLRVTLDSIADGMISTDGDGLVLFMNPAAEQLTGCSAADAVGRAVDSIFVLRDGTSGVRQDCPVSTCLANNGPTYLDDDMILIHRGGTQRDIRCVASPVRTPRGDLTGAVLVFQDVTQSRTMQRELAHSATHDDLTGLPNRPAFERALNAAIVSARDNRRRHCLLYIDLDRFKPVNDNAGHAAGDALLRQVAQTIRGACRNHDVAARIGGDEFAVLLADCTGEIGARVAEKMVRAIAALVFVWAGRTYQIGASVGMTMVTDQPASPLGFMGEADAACYAAKARGRGIAVAFRDL